MKKYWETKDPRSANEIITGFFVPMVFLAFFVILLLLALFLVSMD